MHDSKDLIPLQAEKIRAEIRKISAESWKLTSDINRQERMRILVPFVAGAAMVMITAVVINLTT